MKKHFYLLIFLYFSLTLLSDAQVDVPVGFKKVSKSESTVDTYHIQGDFTILGNTNLTLRDFNPNTNGVNVDNNRVQMEYVNISNEADILNSSSSDLQFSNENNVNPDCSEILFAGLYWSGRAEPGIGDSFEVRGIPLNKRKVKFKGPLDDEFIEVKANQMGAVDRILYPEEDEYLEMFVGYADVTDLVNVQGQGTYTVGNIALTEGNGGDTGYFGHWALIVVYKNEGMQLRDISIFDGYAFVAAERIGTFISGSIDIEGFNASQFGDVKLKLGILAGEGDRNITGDRLEIRNAANTNWVPLSHSLNTSDNFFNASIYTPNRIDNQLLENRRNPNYINNSGIDIAMWEVPNPNNSIIANGQTKTSFRFGTRQDLYIIYALAFSVDAYESDIEAKISVFDSKNIPMEEFGLENLSVDDIISFKIDIRNLGFEDIEDAYFELGIPDGVLLLEESLQSTLLFDNDDFKTGLVNNGLQAEYDSKDNTIKWNLGNLPEVPGGTLSDVIAELNFKITPIKNCDWFLLEECLRLIPIQGIISGKGHITNMSVEKNTVFGERDFSDCNAERFEEGFLVLKVNDLSSCENQSSNIPLVFDFSERVFDENRIPFEEVAGLFPNFVRFYSAPPSDPSATEYTMETGFPSGQGTFDVFFDPYLGTQYSCTIALTLISFEDLDVEVSSIIIPDCENGQLSKTVDLNVLGGVKPYEFIWSDDSVDQNEQTFTINQDGIYTLTIKDQSGQKFNAEFELHPYERLALNIEVFSESLASDNAFLVGVPISFSIAPPDDINSIFWDFGNGQVSTSDGFSLSYQEPGTYGIKLIVEDKWGCIQEEIISIDIIDHFLMVPEVFSPNQDGLNDNFFPVFTMVEKLKFSVFNKWGELIFFTEDITSSGWDGEFKGQLSPQGIYVYNLQYETFDGRNLSKSGSFLLKR
ncbi:MAG: PKD domain-containing protein [Mongoliibacter sp.]|uniref:T9SS type B sorting domain-containing protein n=1 Tax=Mongoliibacter sp. TaxID=2022438 RepID=UPI0012F3C33E|nr:gliding motility-associated C-terminal domain-containing protein [Mongoliibacter sp.]TVP47806.1 MAG: PKD domain-containing protein [Mongoliibacter sp.]